MKPDECRCACQETKDSDDPPLRIPQGPRMLTKPEMRTFGSKVLDEGITQAWTSEQAKGGSADLFKLLHRYANSLVERWQLTEVPLCQRLFRLNGLFTRRFVLVLVTFSCRPFCVILTNSWQILTRVKLKLLGVKQN